MKRASFVMGNWKMNGSVASIKNLLSTLKEGLSVESCVNTVVFPPAIYLPLVEQLLTGSDIAWGAQNIYPKDHGAFTGEISLPMLKDYSCQYVLVGHSERRQLFHETEKNVAEKFQQVKEHDMIPVLCVGESLSEREQGLTTQVLERQLLAVKSHSDFKNCIVAYEPVWAIGTGKTATPDEAQATHAYIRSVVSAWSTDDAENLPIVYGGSVNEKNASALFSMPDIDGGLIGGASLDAKTFLEIVTCINYY